MENKLTVGIDIGGTNSVFGVVDEKGTISFRGEIRTAEYKDAKDFVKIISDKIKKFLSAELKKNLVGIGIGAPNGNYFTGNIEFAPNLPWKDVVPLAELFRSELNVPVTVTNDANAAAIGEKIFGGAKDMKDFVVLTLGTGLGSGIYVNGQMMYGADGNAGEFGHVIVVPGGRLCGCGRKGCLETYVSATGIKRNVLQLLAETNEKSMLRYKPIEELSAKDISAFADQGDLLSIRVFQYTGEMLGKAVADLYSIFSPEAVFLFGGLANAGDLIIEPARMSAVQNAMEIHKHRIKILVSKLDGSDAAILGASALAFL
jgi:glucokinase